MLRAYCFTPTRHRLGDFFFFLNVSPLSRPFVLVIRATNVINIIIFFVVVVVELSQSIIVVFNRIAIAGTIMRVRCERWFLFFFYLSIFHRLSETSVKPAYAHGNYGLTFKFRRYMGQRTRILEPPTAQNRFCWTRRIRRVVRFFSCSFQHRNDVTSREKKIYTFYRSY